MTTSPPTSAFWRRTAGCRSVVCLFALLCLQTLVACNGTARNTETVDIPLPELGEPGPQRPRGVIGVIRRADVPLDQPTDDAWAIINEQAVPPLTRGAWRGNGLRLGLLQSDQLDAYASAMPQPVYYGETLINQSDYDVAIHTTARLRGDLLFEIDLTRPPRPRAVETVVGGKQSTLRLLARIEDADDGRHTLVLTPQHHVPLAPGLLVRDPLEKERDGRIYDELAVRLTLDENQVAVVGLYWPWPGAEQLPSELGDKGDIEQAEQPALLRLPEDITPGYDANDPAAPPPHITDAPAGAPENDAADNEADDVPDARPAPPLPTHFGSTLLTGTRIRQPVRTVLLISIEAPEEDRAQPDTQAAP